MTDEQWSTMPGFTRNEFVCKCGCGLARIHPGFLRQLQTLRNVIHAHTSQGVVLSSGCRCKAHNDRPRVQGGAGGHVRSLHVADHEQHPGHAGCLAVDVRLPQFGAGPYRGFLIAQAWGLGFSIGWGNGFVHLDGRVLLGLPQLIQTTFDY